tara:strand:+ start:684 stop:929 length:246 start_codon:yes stop_codon:yes gene_type:complete
MKTFQQFNEDVKELENLIKTKVFGGEFGQNLKKGNINMKEIENFAKGGVPTELKNAALKTGINFFKGKLNDFENKMNTTKK